MNKPNFYALVGQGPNDVEITALIFSTQQAAFDFVNPILGPPTIHTTRGEKSYHVWEASDWETEKYPEGLENEYDWLPDAKIRKFYTSYYGGCGECWGFRLVPVEEGKPFCKFNLD